MNCASGWLAKLHGAVSAATHWSLNGRYFAEAQSASRQETARRLRGCEVNETTAQTERKRLEDIRSRSRVGRRG